MKLAGRGVVRVVALVTAVTALTAGCSFVRPSPVKQAFLLDPALPAAVATTHPGTARVGIVTVAAPFRGKPFVFREAELKYESDFYAEFLVQPSSIVGDATARALINANVFAAVSPPGIAAEADWVVDCFVGALYGDTRNAAASIAVLEMTFYLTRANVVNGAPAWSKKYVRKITAKANTADAYVAAQNIAFGEILAELVRDLAQLALARG
ncbi:MAG: hypothetical protein H0T80_16065 [Betaproteobacteria bacterium]|nr:hypothetical protein [Betaproteobacteria bacterium]